MTGGTSEAADRRAALALVPVSRETEARLEVYVERLHAWQRIKNLVAPSTLSQVWTRHVADSAQVLTHAPGALRWADLGSGAGFPGLVIAILLCGSPGAEVHLVESNGRKGAFLRDVVRETGAPAIVHVGRIEDVLPRLDVAIEVVTSRALAPVPMLVQWARPLLDAGATGLFLSGEDSRDLDPKAMAGLRTEAIPSLTQAGSTILRITRMLDADRPHEGS